MLRSDGTVVSTATSHLLGATDRITVGGKSYYGAELNYQLQLVGHTLSGRKFLPLMVLQYRRMNTLLLSM
ncbi:DUF4165 domain-containing protein [Escherichia coli]|nr:DUF4165 domain-containing protein [Escherichia coli]